MQRDRVLELRPAQADLANGTAVQLNLVLVAANGHTELIPGQRATWTTSAPAVAEVNRLGRVSARSPGAVTITATHDGKVARAALTVT